MVGVKSLFAAVAIALVAAFALPARAAEDPREVQGRALYAKGEYQAALDLYATLFAEKGDPIYLRNIGRCNQKLRRPDHAIDAFRDYLRRGRNVRAAERTEVEGYIKEMELLKASAEKERERERETVAQAREQEREREREQREAARVATAGPMPAPVETKPAPAPTPSLAPAAAPVVAAKATPAPRLGQTGTFFLSLAVGTGIGLASGRAELNPAHNLAVGGFSPTQLGHIAPEIGIFLSQRLLLSAQLRLQYVAFVNGQYLTDVCGTGERYCRPSSLAVAGFGRIAWLSGDGIVHFLPGLAVGGGNIRHAQEYPDDRMCGEERHTSCVDTVASGPFLFGPSIGVLIELGDTVGLMAAVNTQIGVPKFTLNFDFNAGLTFRL